MNNTKSTIKKALAQYPDDFNEFEWIKYLKEHRSETQALWDKRRELHDPKVLLDFWEPVSPPTRELVMDILKNEYMRFPELKSLLSGAEGDVRGATAHVWFMEYLSSKYDEGTDIQYKTRSKRFFLAKNLAYYSFCRMNANKYNINGPDDPELIAFIDEEIEKMAKKYRSALKKYEGEGDK